MISPTTAAAVADVVTRAEQSILDRMHDDRGRQEPDLVSRLMEGIEVRSETVDGVKIALTTIDGLGRNAAENVIGADILGSVHMDIDGIRLSKGFLLQAKMASSRDLRFRPPATGVGGILDTSHVFLRGPLTPLDPRPTYPMGGLSGTVSVGKPSVRLRKQCDDMLRLTPASFVLVLDQNQVAIVSAAAVQAHGTVARGTRHNLGTKTLADFFANVLDCFIGDQRLGSATPGELVARASLLNIPAAISLRLTDDASETRLTAQDGEQ